MGLEHTYVAVRVVKDPPKPRYFVWDGTQEHHIHFTKSNGYDYIFWNQSVFCKM